MLWLIAAAAVLILLLFPSYWVKRVLRRYSKPRPDYPGTGGEMAEHLLQQLAIENVGVESTNTGDHYDPKARMVRLTEDKLSGKSLTAVVVAAHEVGHALQHKRQEPLFNLRTGLALLSVIVQRVAPIALLATPLLAFLSPGVSRWSLLLAVGSMLVGTLVSLVTLPVEWDASFGKALPMLESGGYLSQQDMKGARKILLAAALTYVAASLFSLLNIGRWWQVLRR